MVQALQAAMVYGILCSQCTELVSKDDSAWVVATIEVSLLRSVHGGLITTGSLMSLF
jgi:hypothetical protein